MMEEHKWWHGWEVWWDLLDDIGGNSLNTVCESVMSYGDSNMCIYKSAHLACIR